MPGLDRADRPARVAMLSVHTSPLEQPGTGDAGGLNVYVVETARRLAERGIEVEVFTRATRSDDPPLAEPVPGVLVRSLVAGPFEGLSKNDLPGQLCAFAAGVMRVEARQDPGWYDLIHSHYWLSGQVGWLAADRWQAPLVHTMHTMAKVKNAALAEGDAPEPPVRIIGEEQVVAAADRLVANTAEEAGQLVDLYQAEPERVAVVSPGVDLDAFTPADPGQRRAARRRLGLDRPALDRSGLGRASRPVGIESSNGHRPDDGQLVLFVGRIQPLKAPDVLVRAMAELLAREPSRRGRLRLAVLGGPSGTGLERPEQLQQLAAELGVADVVSFHPPVPRAELADWYRAADLVAVPSYTESFGLVAVEAQACGVPVVAAAVGGLRTAVDDGHSGVLVDGHDPARWARVIADLLDDEPTRRRLGSGAVRHAAAFSWDATVDRLLEVYAGAIHDHRREVGDSNGRLAVAAR
jgi:D-inositol-3-phosphate glycosyltransferase